MEILSPVRDMATLKVAINSGANAVYFAGAFFSARVGAHCSIETAIEMIQHCKKRHVKCYLTVNTLIYENELNNFFDYLTIMYQHGIDAFIIQNVGLIPILKKHYPDCEIHASTQMHVSTINAALLVKDLGVDRIVLPRELDFNDIAAIKKCVNIPVEVFGHGALCVSYSGQCLISSLIGERSANKGNCAQICRKNYQLSKNGIVEKGLGPMLSLKDLNVSDNLENFLNVQVDSFKIEGRLKSIEYIYATTMYYANRFNSFKDSEITKDDLAAVFNRGFTGGKINNENSELMLSHNRVNHMGLEIGYVLESSKTQCVIKLFKPLNRLDHLRFVSNNNEDGVVCSRIIQNNKEVQSVLDGIVVIPFNRQVEKNSKVFKINNMLISKRAKEFVDLDIIKNHYSLELIMRVNQPIEAHLILDNNCIIFKTIEKSQVAQNQPVSCDRIIAQLQKTNHTSYVFDMDIIKYETLFIAMSQINDLKAEIVSYLDTYYTKKRNNHLPVNIAYQRDTSVQQQSIVFQVSSVKHALMLNEIISSIVYVSNLEEYEEIKKVLEEFGHTVVPITPNIILEKDINKIRHIVENEPIIMVSELSMLNIFKNSKELITNYSCYTTNHFDQLLYESVGVVYTTLSIEASIDQMNAMSGLNSEVIIYGYLKAMNLNVCPLNHTKNTYCLDCKMCQNDQYELVNEQNDHLKLKYVGFDQLALFQAKPINLVSKINNFGQHIRHFRVILEFENDLEVKTILKEINQKIKIFK